jgi:hypothetical protein
MVGSCEYSEYLWVVAQQSQLVIMNEIMEISLLLTLLFYHVVIGYLTPALTV